jgi:hypothetical protein
MSVAQDFTRFDDLRKEEQYLLKDLAYHQEQLCCALREVHYHTRKFQEGLEELEAIKGKLLWEV